MKSSDHLKWMEDIYASQMPPAQEALFRRLLHPEGSVVDFSQYPNRRPMCFDNQGNMRPCEDDVIETTGRVVDKDSPKENAIAKRR